jgi:hypothetical protein
VNLIYRQLLIFFLLVSSARSFAAEKKPQYLDYEKNTMICASDEIDISLQIEEKKKNLNTLESIHNKLNIKCMKKDFFRKFTFFLKAVEEQEWQLDFHEVYDLFKTIQTNQESWNAIAKKKDAIIKRTAFLVNETGKEKKASFFIVPNYQWLVSYKNRILGKGSSKKAKTIMNFDTSSTIRHINKFTLLKANKKKNLRSIKNEIKIYEIINAYSKDHFPEKKIPGLSQGLPFQLKKNEYAIIQENYDSELKEKMLKGRFGKSILKTIAQGLRHLHAMGFVHGDIKEDNILVKRKGKNLQVDISDFGCTTDTHTQPVSRGSASHEAPEMLNPAFQIKSQEQIQKRDIFAWGMIALNTLPSEYRVKTPYEYCYKHFKDYYKDTKNYKKCIKKYAPTFHEKIEGIASELCRSDKECLFEIIADTLHPHPDQRPDARTLYKLLTRLD